MELNDFNIINDIPTDLKSIIKSFYVFGGNPTQEILFVTIDDKVFGLGGNDDGVCGQGNNKRIEEPLIIRELSDKKVKEFFNGYNFVLCLTSDNKLLSWGRNDHGQLGIGCVNINRYYEPHFIRGINNKIVQICCGEGHSLVLTEEGVVYGWGDNRWGQTGVGQQSDKFITLPQKWNIESKVIKIHCSRYQSFAITECGRIYCCGRNDECQLGLSLEKDECIYNPTLLDIINVQNIITSKTNTYFVSKEGDIYFCGFYYNNSQNEIYQQILLKIINMKNIKTLTSSNYRLNYLKCGLIYDEDSIYEIKFEKIEKTAYKTFEEYLYNIFDNKTESLLETRITYKTVHINYNEMEINSYFCKNITEKYVPRYLKNINNIDKFVISKNISKDMKQFIKYFHVFKYFGRNILFVTIDDKVFGLGNNICGVCGVGHQNEINSIESIPELWDKRVKQFFTGKDFVLCLTSDYQLFSWGKNDHGQLGIGVFNLFKIFKPRLIKYFNYKTIVQVCCSYTYSSVLTSDNCVHLWGYYNYDKEISSPIECKLEEEIKLISCSELITFCVTKCGKVYYLEVNSDKKIVSISFELLTNIEWMCSTEYYIYFISNDSTIYSINNQKVLLNEIKTKLVIGNSICETNHQCILNRYQQCVLFFDNSVYEFLRNECWKTKYKNLFDYYCDRHEITFETYEVRVVENEKNNVNITTNYFIKNFVSQENNLSNILKTFHIAKQIGVLKSFIKYFHIFFDMFGHNILFITNDESVYGFGSNFCGCCGLGHNNSVSEPQEITELYDKNVIKFFNGRTYTIALTNDNQIYAWGVISNDFDLYSKPTKIFNSDEYKIENICCASRHGLFLNEEGIVYGWGDNSDGQIEYGKEYFITYPLKINNLPKIKIITCYNNYSIVVSEDNMIFVWGEDIYENIVIQCEHDILNICIYENIYLYIFTRNGEFLYCMISGYRIFKKIECNNFIDSFFHEFSYNVVLILIENDVFVVGKNQELVQTKYKNVYDYCAEELQITYKTIDLKLQNEIKTKELNIKGKY